MQELNVSRLFDGEKWLDNVCIVLENGAIKSISPATKSVDDGILVPGFIDVQVNGGGGALFNSAPTRQTLNTMMQAHACFGTTAMLPTVITDSVDVMQQASDAIASAIKDEDAGIIGVHFEGPHLSVPKKGVHPQKYIRPLTSLELAIYARDDIGIKLVTVAPENISPEQIKALVSLNVIVCLGHSNADAKTVEAALEAGATGFTHLYNAMSAFTSREPGMVGVALSHKNSWCGMILDGHHMHAIAAKVALAAKPKGKLMIVTDAMSPVGTSETEFAFFDGKVIREGNKLTNEAGALAGSVLDMIGAVKYAVNDLGVSLDEALKMASLYPAQFLNQGLLGKITQGQKANFVWLTSDLDVKATWANGQLLYKR